MHMDLLTKALPIMGVGYLGIFFVIAIIILVVKVLNGITKSK